MEYKIVVEGSTSGARVCEYLENKVKELISDGWEPIGGIAVAVDTGGWYTASQAMIKRAKKYINI